MVMGSSGIFGSQSLVDSYMNGLDPKSTTYWRDVQDFAEYVVSLQTGGYAAWITALNLKGMTTYASQIYERAAQRMEEQSRKLLPLVTGNGLKYFSNYPNANVTRRNYVLCIL